MPFSFFHKRPLFYFAILLSGSIAVLSFSGAWDKFFPLPKDDISHFAKKGTFDCFIGGTVISEVEERPSWKGKKDATFVLEARKLWSADKKEVFEVSGRTKVFLYYEKSDLRYGDEVVLKGRLDRARPATNPNGFDKRKYLARKNIHSVFYADPKEEHKKLSYAPINPVFARALKVKQALSRAIHQYFEGDTAAFLAALFLGERTDLSEEFKDLFIRTGTLHILAVSGFNIGFLCAILWFFMKPFPFPRDAKLVILLAMLWAYCLVVGWQPALVRASLMATVWILGKLLGRKTDTLNTIGFAACIILLLKPKELFDAGFQLSFLAVFALARYLPIFYTPEKEDRIKYVNELFWGSFVCLVVTLPVTSQNFYIVTPLSLIANLAVVPLTFAIFFLGTVFFFIFSWMPPALGIIVSGVAMLMNIMVLSLKGIEALPGAYFISGKLAWPLWTILTAGIFYLLETKRFTKPLLRAFAVAGFVAIIFVMQAAWLNFSHLGKLRATTLDVGQGDAIFLEFPNGKNMLIDGGKGLFSDKGRWVVAPFLKSKGIHTIDVLVATHPQEDHIGGLPVILDEFKIKKVIEPKRPYKSKIYENFKKKTAEEGAEYIEASAGTLIEGFGDAEVKILNPVTGAAAHKNINEDSVVLSVRYRESRWLFTGDIQKDAMASLLQSDEALSAEVLKVPHHGAKLDSTGKAFVERVGPRVSVISAGERNLYRHPHPETLGVLKAIPGNEVFRTDENGAIEVISDGSKLDVKTWRAAA